MRCQFLLFWPTRYLGHIPLFPFYTSFMVLFSLSLLLEHWTHIDRLLTFRPELCQDSIQGENSLHKSGLSCHWEESRIPFGQKSCWRIGLHKVSIREDNDPVAVHDGVEPVRDGDDGAVPELLPDCCLDQVVRFQVDRCSCFVQNNHLAVPQTCSSQTKELPLPDWKIVPSLINRMLKASGQARHVCKTMLFGKSLFEAYMIWGEPAPALARDLECCLIQMDPGWAWAFRRREPGPENIWSGHQAERIHLRDDGETGSERS